MPTQPCFAGMVKRDSCPETSGLLSRGILVPGFLLYFDKKLKFKDEIFESCKRIRGSKFEVQMIYH